MRPALLPRLSSLYAAPDVGEGSRVETTTIAGAEWVLRRRASLGRGLKPSRRAVSDRRRTGRGSSKLDHDLSIPALARTRDGGCRALQPEAARDDGPHVEATRRHEPDDMLKRPVA